MLSWILAATTASLGPVPRCHEGTGDGEPKAVTLFGQAVGRRLYREAVEGRPGGQGDLPDHLRKRPAGDDLREHETESRCPETELIRPTPDFSFVSAFNPFSYCLDYGLGNGAS